MSSTGTTPNQRPVSGLLNPYHRAKPGTGSTHGIRLSRCRSQIVRIVDQIDSSKVYDIVFGVFENLICGLERLLPLENRLNQVATAEDTFSQLQFVQDQTATLVSFIKEEALSCDNLDPGLFDALDATAFAIGHDLKTLAESKHRLPPASERMQIADDGMNPVVGELGRSYDILNNCLQQATIALATVFDPGLQFASLFSNSDMRYWESVQLCEDLSSLMKLTEVGSEPASEADFEELEAAVQTFRNERLKFLMCSDWAQFESFCDRIRVGLPDLSDVVHQFRCYLATLLGQVRMRAVLANNDDVSGGDNSGSALETAAEVRPAYLGWTLDDEDEEFSTVGTCAIAL